MPDTTDDGGVQDPGKFSFLSSYDRLPASATSNHAHIIDMESYAPADDVDIGHNPKIWDAIATMLFEISDETLSDFLNASNKTFQLIASYADGRMYPNQFVWRKGNQVMVGLYTQYPEKDLIEFDDLVRCTINMDGSWKRDEASHGRYTRSRLNEIWAGRFVQTSVSREGPSDRRSQANYATSIARIILETKIWKKGSGWKWIIKKT